MLTVRCPDRVGIVAAVTGLIASHGGWVLEAAQHGDLETGQFFQRIEVLADSLPFDLAELGERFGEIARTFELTWTLTDSDVAKRVAVLVSREDHCLNDLLHRWRTGDLACEIVAVISNHAELRDLAESHGIEFAHVPVGADDRASAFAEMQRIIEAARTDVIVLARYMQILPPALCERFEGQIINIHHSFLPSFAGARPYHQALERGVKLIGATCHYVTSDLDQGPIIEQDTRRIDHGDAIEDLVRIGREIECSVLARGLRWHLEDRVLLNGARTVVFP